MLCRFFLERLVSFGKGFRAEVKSLSRFALSRRAAHVETGSSHLTGERGVQWQ